MTTRDLAALLFGGVEVLDLCGPFEVFSVANAFTDPPAFRVFTVAERPGPVLTRGGLSANPRRRLADSPRPDLRRGRVWSVRPILSYRCHGRLVGGAERRLGAGRRAAAGLRACHAAGSGAAMPRRTSPASTAKRVRQTPPSMRSSSPTSSTCSCMGVPPCGSGGCAL